MGEIDLAMLRAIEEIASELAKIEKHLNEISSLLKEGIIAVKEV